VVIQVTEQVAPGQKYLVEIGWYYQPTMERLLIVNSAGQPIDDKVVISPLTVE